MRILTVEQVIELHSRLIQTTSGLDGVRDAGLIESSLSSSVFNPYFGVDYYSSIEEKAARLCYLLVNNHACFFRIKWYCFKSDK